VANDIAAAVVSAGCIDLGESRPQELWQKHESLSAPDVRWHFIGHLQRNKVRRTLPMIGLLHSADSMRLIEELNQECVRSQRRLPVLLEVNISGEQAKHGFAPDELESSLPSIAQLSNIDVRGLMAMAGLEGDLDDARREFRAVRMLRDRLSKVVPLTELSMGMSGDFEVAIEEGATIVRVGSALFEGLP
jgi:pyridoxal phosphate enzyme (YggS family)